MTVEVRFYAELNDFLARRHQGRSFECEPFPGTTVKDLVESLGVPHTEIDVVVVNGESVGFGYRVVDGDRVDAYPPFAMVDVTPLVHLWPAPLRPERFVLDVHLGRLARLLRLLGFDALWHSDAEDAALVATSVGQGRILLTRDRGILKRGALVHAYYVRETGARRQLVEVVRRFDLLGAVRPFGRCLECNGLIVAVDKREVEDRVPPRTRRDFEEFCRCTGCERVYWKGSHYDRLRAVVDEVARQGGSPQPATKDLGPW